MPADIGYIARGSLNIRIKVLDTTSAEIVFQTTRGVMLRPDNDVDQRKAKILL